MLPTIMMTMTYHDKDTYKDDDNKDDGENKYQLHQEVITGSIQLQHLSPCNQYVDCELVTTPELPPKMKPSTDAPFFSALSRQKVNLQPGLK